MKTYTAFNERKTLREWSKDFRCKVTYKQLNSRVGRLANREDITDAIFEPTARCRDLTGLRFGRLTVISKLEEQSFQATWLCKCDCGVEKIISSSNIKRTRSCGCLRKEMTSQRRKNEGDLTARNIVLHRTKHIAKKKSREWDLQNDEFFSLVQMDCFYCDQPPNQIKTDYKGENKFIHHGLDRIDSSKGYVKSNVVPCCKTCNLAKSNLKEEDFYSHIKRTHDNLLSRGLIPSFENNTTYGGKIGIQASILILAFERPEETRFLLKSIKRHVKFNNYETILYVNGGRHQESFWGMYKDGLIDLLIVSKNNEGSGIGTLNLIKSCRTNLFFYIQNDNFFRNDITQEHVNWMEKIKLTKEIGGFDLTGLVPSNHKFSERAFISWRDYYLSNANIGIGGTGPHSNLEGTEPSFTKFLEATQRKIMPFHGFIGDSGKYSIVQLPCGGVLKRRCDSQELKVEVQPKEKSPIFSIADDEWDIILAGQWSDWTIPAASREWVFHFYSNEFENPANEIYRRK